MCALMLHLHLMVSVILCVFNATYLDIKYMLGPVSSCVVKYKIL